MYTKEQVIHIMQTTQLNARWMGGSTHDMEELLSAIETHDIDYPRDNPGDTDKK